MEKNKRTYFAARRSVCSFVLLSYDKLSIYDYLIIKLTEESITHLPDLAEPS